MWRRNSERGTITGAARNLQDQPFFSVFKGPPEGF